MSDTILLEYQGEFSKGWKLDDVVRMVETIPPMPQAARKTLELVEDPNSTPYEIAGIMARDPALVSTVMRAANSAALGRSETVVALEEAILVVGLGSIKSIVLGMTLKKWNKSFGPTEKLIWEKSLGTAAAAYVLATFLGKTYQDTARLCGLLHNLGQIVMLSLPDIRAKYPEVFAYIREHGVSFVEAERAVIGLTHPLVGAMVGRKWQLPFSICNTILRYDEPFEGIDNTQDEQIALTKLAAELSLCAGLGCPEGHPLFCSSLRPVALALGFEESTLMADQAVLARQTKVLYATEAVAYN